MRLVHLLLLVCACGCNGLQPIVNPLNPVNPPAPAVEPQKVIVELKVSDGKLTVNDATINVAQTKTAGDSCPCCGTTRVCQGLCGKPGCNCSRNEAAAVPTAGNATDLPQFVTQYRDRIVCENGVCRTIREEVRVPIASAAKRPVSASTQGGTIVIYDAGSDGGRAMRAAIGAKGFDWKNSESPVAINGVRWSPTAVKPDGSAWTPGAGGWHDGSKAQFEAWL